MNFDTLMRHEARYIMLRELKNQPGYRLSDALLERVLEAFGISRSHDFVTSEINWLADVGAVTSRKVGDTTIAEMTKRGLDHVDGRTLIDGIKRPSPEA